MQNITDKASTLLDEIRDNTRHSLQYSMFTENFIAVLSNYYLGALYIIENRMHINSSNFILVIPTKSMLTCF